MFVVFDCVVAGVKQYSADLPQGALEVPCILRFEGNDKNACVVHRRLIFRGLKFHGSPFNHEIHENKAPRKLPAIRYAGQGIFPAPFPLHFPNFRTCNGNSTENVLCSDLKSDISFYASAGNLAFLPLCFLWLMVVIFIAPLLHVSCIQLIQHWLSLDFRVLRSILPAVQLLQWLLWQPMLRSVYLPTHACCVFIFSSNM